MSGLDATLAVGSSTPREESSAVPPDCDPNKLEKRGTAYGQPAGLTAKARGQRMIGQGLVSFKALFVRMKGRA